MIDIEILRLVWWALIGILLMGFAITDGYDFGAAMLLPLIARNEVERRIVLNCIGPFWEGNQVWIILGAGALFAAWPMIYAVAFSSFYLLVLLLLLTMGISRPVSFKYRSKLKHQRWRDIWDFIVFIGGFFPALFFGILLGNVLTGIPFHFDRELRVFNETHFFALFKPFSLWCGLTSLLMLAMHGALFIAIKTNDLIRSRAIRYSRIANILFMLCFIIGGIWIAYGIAGYQVVSVIDPKGFSNPLPKAVVSTVGGWLLNYQKYPIILLAPALVFVGSFLAFIFAEMSFLAFVFSAFAIVGVISTVGLSMYPFILPSSIHLSSSLLIWDSSSTALTLFLMLCAVILFLPIILIYTAWVFSVLKGKVSNDIMTHDAKHTTY